MTLETGTYIILNQLTKAPIGPTPERLTVVRVVSLPESVSPPFVSRPIPFILHEQFPTDIGT